MFPSPDAVVVGAGPAGRAAAHRIAAAGAVVVLVDPHPDRRWTQTYAMWDDELPAWLPADVRATTTRSATVVGARRHHVARAYTVLDTVALQRALTVDPAAVVRDVAVSVDARGVTLRSGGRLGAGVVIDARGSAVGPGVPEQRAYGVIVRPEVAEPALGGAETLVMDWRRDNVTDPHEHPTFLYGVQLDADRVLLEETSLVGEPGPDQPELAARLHRRLQHRGVALRGEEAVERVRFAMAPPSVTPAGVEVTGARSAALHPATGYSVASSLRRADALARHVVDGTPVTSRATAAVASLRRLGGQVLLGLPPDELADFFDRFFDLPVAAQRAYLSGDGDLPGTARAMGELFRGAGSGHRRAIVRTVGRRARVSVPWLP